MISIKRGFTLIELLVVIAMIAVIMGALTSSVASAQERARKQKAMSDVKIISQAILGYENFNEAGGRYELPTMRDADADQGSLGFLLGKSGTTESGDRIPVLLMAALKGGGKMMDPWGTPYKVTIKEGNGQVRVSTASGSMQTGYFLPNFYRLGAGERNL